MKFLKIALFMALVVPMFIISCDKGTNAEKYAMSFEVPDSVSYSIGLSMAAYLQRQGIRSVDIDAYGDGMKAGLKLGEIDDSKKAIDSVGAIIQEFMMGYNQEMQAKMAVDSTLQPELMDLPKEVSYNFGVLLGSNLVAQNLGQANIAELVSGVKDHFANTPKYKEDISGSVLQRYFDLVDSLRVGVNERYLVDNKAKKGVVTTPSGLQYEVIKKGDGATPVATDVVRVHYKGTFVNGKTFDSSYDRNEPAEFPLNGVIPGWTEGIALMPIGSKYTFTIPQDLGYGEMGTRDGSIQPKTTLVFEVELLDIVPPAPAPEAVPGMEEPTKEEVGKKK
jgi:FKBP-type peptidyl-prolyl cis-trans isomerase